MHCRNATSRSCLKDKQNVQPKNTLVTLSQSTTNVIKSSSINAQRAQNKLILDTKKKEFRTTLYMLLSFTINT